MSKRFFLAYSLARYPNEESLVQCKDVSFVADVKTLRKIGEFLLQSADSIEKVGEGITSDWHAHLRDEWEDWEEDFVDLIVCPISTA